MPLVKVIQSVQFLLYVIFSWMSCLTGCKNKVLTQDLWEWGSSNTFIQILIVLVSLDARCWNLHLSVCDSV